MSHYPEQKQERIIPTETLAVGSNTTLTENQSKVFATAGGITLTLPSASVVGSGSIFFIKDRDGNAGGNSITIDGSGSQTIDGDLTLELTTNFQSVSIVSDGSNWSVIDNTAVSGDRTILPEWFGAVGDGTTDDATAIQAAIDFAEDLEGGAEIWFSKASYAITTGLTVNQSGVSLIGPGTYSPHDVGVLNTLPMLKWTGVAGGTMLTIAPIEGPSAQRLDANHLRLNFNGNSLAAKGVILKSVRSARIDAYVQETTNTGFEMDVATTLGETEGCNFNTLNLVIKHLVNSAVGLRLKSGIDSSNIAFNMFQNINIIHDDGDGMVVENADNNTYQNVALFRASGGTGNGIVWEGGPNLLRRARNELFYKLSCNSSLIVRGTGSFTVAATDIMIYELDVHNYPSVAPTIETGASAYWRSNENDLVGFSATDNSATSYGAGPTDVTFNTETYDDLAQFASPTFTAKMGGKYDIKLQLYHTNGVTASDKWVFKLVTTNRTYSYHYTVQSAAANTVQFSVLADLDVGDTAKWTIERGLGTGNFPLAADNQLNSFSAYHIFKSSP